VHHGLAGTLSLARAALWAKCRTLTSGKTWAGARPVTSAPRDHYAVGMRDLEGNEFDIN